MGLIWRDGHDLADHASEDLDRLIFAARPLAVGVAIHGPNPELERPVIRLAHHVGAIVDRFGHQDIGIIRHSYITQYLDNRYLRNETCYTA